MHNKIKRLIVENLFLIFWTGLMSFALAIAIMPGIVAYSEGPSFCATCHSMKGQYKSWGYSKHRSAKCIDCHLPNNNVVEHFVWKGIDGTKDVVSQFLGLKEEDEIRLSEHGKKVLQKNCIRCHKDIVSHIDNKRSCIDCHKTIHHRHTAAACSFNTEDSNGKK